MGRKFVHQESIGEPGKRSRLWDNEDIYDVLTERAATEAVRGVVIDYTGYKFVMTQAEKCRKKGDFRS
ncbi:hypothetical protein HRI_005191900 [Hibiscus trionum]|uniref:Uncharacterized protein n=1 Tax=Hibiscus trionum TaxID=183268 RepID=A0A9W7JKV4_HIBTR|nr:hypothetical protein HRI_005191900 [Hibiscus trionum]